MDHDSNSGTLLFFLGLQLPSWHEQTVLFLKVWAAPDWEVAEAVPLPQHSGLREPGLRPCRSLTLFPPLQCFKQWLKGQSTCPTCGSGDLLSEE